MKSHVESDECFATGAENPRSGYPEFTNPEAFVENTATELGSATFGFPGFTRPPRQMRFALKFYF